ncbi:hypothetical protein BCD48_26595 [Pseudofrankia sp. BMG5.36]|nr:hypothetical protein BCD48_26595 [Pseudofrankia sp. BMG5.36]
MLGDNTTDLEVDDRIPVEAEVGESGVAVLVELRGAADGGRPPVEPRGGGDELEGDTERRLAALYLPVGEGLRVVD